MRRQIKKLLCEKLASVNDDVDLLYNLYFKNDIDEINRTGFVSKNMFAKMETDTSILRNEESVDANKVNPCKIHINHVGNSYNPLDKIISLSVSKSALNLVLYFNGDLNMALENLTPKERSMFTKEFTSEKIKGSIHHELAHWLDDTFNGQHIEKRVKKVKLKGSYTRDLNGIPINMTKMEIQGQIHNIKQMHKHYGDIWDEITFNELLAMTPILQTTYDGLTRDQKKTWVRDIKTRMYRENLLGKKMVN